MEASEQTVPAIVLPSWVKAAARCGFNIKPVFQRHGVTLDLIHLEDSVVSLGALDRVLEDCIERAGDTHFPFVIGETFAFEYLPDLETYLTTSSSLRDAARVLEWVPALVNPVIDSRLEETDDHAYLILQLPSQESSQQSSPIRPYRAEMFFASILKFARMLTGATTAFRELHFRHPAPAYEAHYHAFFELPVQFEASRDALVVDRALLDRPLEGDFPALHAQAAELLEQRVARRNASSLAGRVLHAFRRQPELLIEGLEAMARTLGMGARTLQRRLQAEGASFGDVHDEARLQRARTLLDRGATVEAVGEALGFADRRSFTRAFKRWSGTTPSAYRATRFP